MRFPPPRRGPKGVVAAGLVAAGCVDAPPPAPPVVTFTRLEEPADTPLARAFEAGTDVPTRLELRVDTGDRAFTVTFPGATTHHQVPVLGLPPDRAVTLGGRVTDLDGRSTELEPLTFTTAALASWFPTIEVLTLDPAAVEPGYRLLPLETGGGFAWLVVLEAATGEVVWVYDGPVDWGDVRATPGGTLVGLDGGALEMDLLGEVRRRWTGRPGEPGDVPLPWEVLHHELHPLADGGFASLAYGTWEAPAYPVSYDDPTPVAPATLRDTRVVAFDRDGGVRFDWSMAERLDTARIGFDSLDLVGQAYDWSHGNAVVPLDDTGAFLVELRHLDALVVLEADGTVRWVLGDPAGWSLPTAEQLLAAEGELRWPYHPHGPSLDAAGDIVLFDNAVYGHTPYGEPPAEEPASRVVAYRVDAAAGTVRQSWEWEPPDGPLRSAALGNAAALPVTGNVLAAFGFLDGEAEVLNEAQGRGRISVRVIELVPGRAEPVSDLRVSTPLEVEPEGVKAYRAVPMASLYADGVVVTGE